MPPVREPSTKPSAATVLPAPVACSNQKRLRGVRVLGRLGELLLVVRRPRRRSSSQSCGSSGSSSSSSSSSPGMPGRGERRRPARDFGPAPLASAAVARLGEQRGERARQRVDLVGGEHRAVDELRLVLAQQAVEPEQQRPALAPRDRRDLRARLELGQRGVERAPARRVPARARTAASSPVEHERLAGERRGALDRVVGRRGWQARPRRPLTWDSANTARWDDRVREPRPTWCATPRIRGPRSEAWSRE